MNDAMLILLSEYVLGQRSFDELRRCVDDVDWGDPSIPETDRSVLLHVEALIGGVDADLNDASDIQDYVLSRVEVITSMSASGVLITTGVGNAVYPLQLVDFVDWDGPSIQFQEADPSGLIRSHASTSHAAAVA